MRGSILRKLIFKARSDHDTDDKSIRFGAVENAIFLQNLYEATFASYLLFVGQASLKLLDSITWHGDGDRVHLMRPSIMSLSSCARLMVKGVYAMSWNVCGRLHQRDRRVSQSPQWLCSTNLPLMGLIS